MRIDSMLTDDAVLGELGRRLARIRLDRNVTQQQLADQAGVGRRQVQRIESGDPVTSPILIRVLRALEVLDALDVLVPEPGPSPIELLKLQGGKRQRASGQRASQPVQDGRTWTWGDEAAGTR